MTFKNLFFNIQYLILNWAAPWGRILDGKKSLRAARGRLGWALLGSLLTGVIFLPAAEAGDSIRVLIMRDVSLVKVTGEGLKFFDLKTDQPFFKNRKYNSLVFEREAGPRVRIGGQNLAPAGVLVQSVGNPLWVNGRSYRGKLRIICGPNRDLWIINELPLEEYLVGLINFEVSSQWPMEVLKAQVIAARTFAVYQRRNRSGEPYDVDSGVEDQVYGGIGKEDARSRRAVEETRGEFVHDQGTPVFSVYSACCGGKTESGEYMWAGAFPHLRSVECPYCLDSPHFLWNYSIEGNRLAAALGMASLSRVVKMDAEERSPSGRVLSLTLHGEANQRQLSGKDFRRLLGYDRVRSTNFIVKEKEGTFYFSGLGWGHGVGLCQWGAKGMAEVGADYRTILKFYYHGVVVGKTQR